MGVVVPVGESVATMIYSCDGLAKECTWSLGFTTASMASLSSQAEDWWTELTTGSSNERPCHPNYMNPFWHFLGVSVMNMTMTGPLVGDYMDTVDGGNSGSDVLPPNCAVLATKNTGLGGRKYRGRNYFPPVYPNTAGVDQAGSIDSVSLAQMETNMSNALSAIEIGGYQPVLHHSDGSAGTAVNGMSFKSLIATQRRRIR